ncbi:hypothetical protein B0A48_05979 [Cryoendolithus antarcticus]|uniref:Serine/threonine-protein kinase fhkC n=1 Tax=Cryoendolithus antarcticus TaxID=1507870 RepID=A0A1V8TCV2_9PEZI|nr:hypothetical protein B0A48_05979 [Cryoendolithus antarcticus]
MAPNAEKSALKRARVSIDEALDTKKPRRSARLSNAPDREDGEEQLKNNGALPSPVTKASTDTTEGARAFTPTPDFIEQRATPEASPSHGSHRPGLSSPPSDTQPFSQFLPPPPYSYEVEDEAAEGVWGYLVPIDGVSETLVLRKRAACQVPSKGLTDPHGKKKVPKKHYKEAEEKYEGQKAEKGVPAGGYLIGRHPECDRLVQSPTVSNRHCLLFCENKNGDSLAVVEDLSGNGTYVNDAFIGRNKRRELADGDELSILDEARFIFRYPRNRDTNAFRSQYTIQGQLGKGHFATVYLATEKQSGLRYAVKKFEKRSGPGERSKVEGLQQEIAVLMAISHPNMLCLKDTFDESDGVYLVLELAPEGELFNWIVTKQKMTESETRKIFAQLFQGVKYMHERNIVHRDIKPENILLIDKELHVKLADFGLAKIIGEESFTSTLCGTPSYVAPEILEQSNRRRYTRAVDVWSLGVVLYICLCGFPPFSDELYSAENPYTLSQQIKMGRFDYPSPYWDAVGDPALDLIDRMLTVDSDKRITIDECLEHPWLTQQPMTLTDSTDGLTGALAGLDFTRRKPVRERTLLSSINDVRVGKVLNSQKPDQPAVKVWDKNQGTKKLAPQQRSKAKGGHFEQTLEQEVAIEERPDAARDPQEFMGMGGKGDEQLFEEQTGSIYPGETIKEVKGEEK